MNGRIKPRFEDLANAALQKPTYTTPQNAFVPPGGNELAIAEFQNMSQKIKRNQYDAAALLAKAQQIARDRGVSVEIALNAIAHEQSAQATQRDMAAQASASAAGQDRYDLLNEDRLMGQIALKFRHNAQINSVAQQVRAVPNPFLQLALENVPPPSPGTGTALANALTDASPAAGTPLSANVSGSQSPEREPQAAGTGGNQAPVQGLQAAAAAAAATTNATDTAVPEGDVDMTNNADAIFIIPAPAPKNYFQLRQELKDGLQQALNNEPALLVKTLQHIPKWCDTAQRAGDSLTVEQATILSSIQQLEAVASIDRPIILQHILRTLDMADDLEIASKIAAATVTQFNVAPMKGAAHMGSDRTNKPHTTAADHRSGANLASTKKAAVSGQARDEQLAGKRGVQSSGTPDARAAHLHGSPVGFAMRLALLHIQPGLMSHGREDCGRCMLGQRSKQLLRSATTR